MDSRSLSGKLKYGYFEAQFEEIVTSDPVHAVYQSYSYAKACVLGHESRTNSAQRHLLKKIVGHAEDDVRFPALMKLGRNYLGSLAEAGSKRLKYLQRAGTCFQALKASPYRSSALLETLTVHRILLEDSLSEHNLTLQRPPENARLPAAAEQLYTNALMAATQCLLAAHGDACRALPDVVALLRWDGNSTSDDAIECHLLPALRHFLLNRVDKGMTPSWTLRDQAMHCLVTLGMKRRFSTQIKEVLDAVEKSHSAMAGQGDD